MAEMTMGAGEEMFAEIIWENEPLPSTALAKLSEQKLGWKKSTSYTVLRRLSQKGIIKTEDGVVRSVVSREEFNSIRSENFVDETFGGSLPAFIAAFASRKKLSDEAIAELRQIVEDYGKNGE